MRIAIIDDEPLARDRLRGQLAELGIGEIVCEAGNGLAGIEAVERLRPDVVLLDIRMPGMGGIETAQHLSRLESPPAVIFTTAYDEHALAAFDAHAIDYLLKPIRTERLNAALSRAGILTQAQAAGAGHQARDGRTHISALVHGNLRIVEVKDIRFFQADQGYVCAAWPHGSLLIEESLRTVEEEFGERFVRVHRNALAAVAHICGLEKDGDGNTVVVLRDMTQRLPVSRRLLRQVRKRLRG